MSVYSDSNVLGGGGGFGFGGFGGGNGIGAVGLIGLNTLFDRGRDGRGDCDGDNSVFGAAILGKLGDISGSIPLVATQIQNGLLEQTGTLTNAINQSALANLQATSNVKDAVQNGLSATLLNNAQNTQSILSAICGLGSKIDASTITQLQNDLAEARHSGRTRDLEVNISQNVNQQSLQFQQQQQSLDLQRKLDFIVGQNARAENELINIGGTVNANQSSAATNVK